MEKKKKTCKREDQISELMAAGGNCPIGRMMEKLTQHIRNTRKCLDNWEVKPSSGDRMNGWC